MSGNWRAQDRSRIAKLAVIVIPCAAGLASATLAWPGIAVYDTVVQYGQVSSGQFDDWHPPIMARLWALLEAAGLHGTGPLLTAQILLFWVGVALVGLALASAGATRVAVVLALSMLFPVVLGWTLVVDKDAQMMAAMLAASGVVTWFHLAQRRTPGWAIIIVAVLLTYAVLLRANAVFAVVPLTLGLWDWGARRLAPRMALLLASSVAVLASLSPIDHRLLGATASHVERTLPLFDLAGIAHFASLKTVPGVPPALWQAGERQRCYTPFFWDHYATPGICGDIGDALTDDDEGRSPIFRNWLRAIGEHPIAYAKHRALHLNANLRFFTPANEPNAAAPAASQPNPFRIGAPANAGTRAIGDLARAICRTVLAAPIVWLSAALTLWWTLAGTPPQPTRGSGLAFAASACLMTASFAVVSIASDLRYHLWLFVGTILAAAMTRACSGVPRNRLAIGGTATLIVALIAGAARLRLTAISL